MSFIKLAPIAVENGTAPGGIPVLDVVVPVYNEETDIRSCVERLHAHLSQALPFSFRITIADNASTDSTPQVADELQDEFEQVVNYRMEEKGRGRALREVWLASDAAVLAYMDVDLSTDLNALLPLIAPLISGHSDLAIGTRLHRGSRVTRGAKREVISRSYNILLRRMLSAGFSDAQCGFKAIRREAADALLPHVEDNHWFFDTEMLVLAERAGLRIHEVPVDWIDDPNSSVHIVGTATEDLRGILRLIGAFGRGQIPLHDISAELSGEPVSSAPRNVPRGLLRQLVRFAAVGVLSTITYVLLYLALNTVMSSQLSNALALLVTAIGNTQLNRSFTFSIRGRNRLVTHQAQGLVVFPFALALSSATLVILHAAYSEPPLVVELVFLVAANGTAAIARFLLLRRWVFRRA